MTAGSIAASGKANQGVEESLRPSGRDLPLQQAIARVARAIWPTKTDLELAVRTGTSDRACRDLLANRGGMSLRAVANLLASEEGREFLEALLGDASPQWRKHLADHIEIAEMRAELEAQRQRIAEFALRSGLDLAAPRAPRRRIPLPRRK